VSVYIPTLGAKSAPKMGHPVVSGLLEKTDNGKDSINRNRYRHRHRHRHRKDKGNRRVGWKRNGLRIFPQPIGFCG
jgi:hypothetical protein